MKVDLWLPVYYWKWYSYHLKHLVWKLIKPEYLKTYIKCLLCMSFTWTFCSLILSCLLVWNNHCITVKHILSFFFFSSHYVQMYTEKCTLQFCTAQSIQRMSAGILRSFWLVQTADLFIDMRRRWIPVPMRSLKRILWQNYKSYLQRLQSQLWVRK